MKSIFLLILFYIIFNIRYYVNVTYTDAPEDPEKPPNARTVPLTRSILAEEPRVTRFPIDWSGASTAELNQDDEEANAEAAAYENRNDEGDGDNNGMDDDDDDDDDDDGEVDLEAVDDNGGDLNESGMQMIGNEDSMDVEMMAPAA